QLAVLRASALDERNLPDDPVLLVACDPIPIPGRYDRTYPFRPHSEYFYLTDRERPGGVLAFDPEEGWVEFVAPVSREELLWSGVDDLQEGTPEGSRPVTELTEWLAAHRGRRCGCLGVPVTGVSSDAAFD